MKDMAFIDIDTQYDFISPKGALYVKDSEKLIPNFKLLTKIAAKKDILVISTVDAHIKNDPEFKEFPRHCVIKTKGAKKIPETLLKKHIFMPLEVQDRNTLFKNAREFRQMIFKKSAYKEFIDLNILRLLKPFKSVFVYGIALDYCVKYAILDLLKTDIKVNLVVDATKAIDDKKGKEILALFKKNGVKFVKTTTLLSRIK